MAWTNLSFSYGAVLTSSQMTQMYDNFAAMAAAGAGSPSITVIGDASGVTQAVGNFTTKVATTAHCNAGYVNRDVGTGVVGVICNLGRQGSGELADGATVAGSALTAAQSAGTDGAWSTGAAPAGTWRNISGMAFPTSTRNIGTFQRIA